MAAQLPARFVDLATGYSKLDVPVNLIGVCVDFLPVAKSRGSDFTIKFTLHDPLWFDGVGMVFRFFNQIEKNLPSIQNAGDVVIVRNVKVKPSQGQFVGLSNNSTTWVVLDGSTIQESKCPSGSDIKYKKSTMAGCPTPVELAYAKSIYESESQDNFAPPPKPTALQIAGIMSSNGGNPPPAKEKFSLVKDLTVPTLGRDLIFAELLGEVRRKYSNDYRVELSITDYTSHSALFNYERGMDEEGTEGDQYGYMNAVDKQWKGPWGKMTINVTLWDAHAAFARQQVKEGEFVYLRNVQIKMDKDRSKLEGVCRGDRYQPDRVNVSIVKARDAEGESRILDLLRRKREYEKKAKLQHERFVRDTGYAGGQADQGIVEDQKHAKSKPTKNRENKMKKRLRNQANGPQANQPDPVSQVVPTDDSRSEPNKQVVCMEVVVPRKMIDDILELDVLKRDSPKGNAFYLPFQNCRYKSKVRVLDYFPDDIADFAAPHRESEYDMLSDQESDIESELDLTQTDGADVRWEWRFFLLVEDASSTTSRTATRPQMQLLVADGDGEFLLNMDACNLRKTPHQLAILREKLFTLWGDLQEQKEARIATGMEVDAEPYIQPHSRPFECLIKEYGVPRREASREVPEYERMFRMFGTTIK